MTCKRRGLNGQNGFTIVELLVATAVLSTILLIVTIVIVGIGNLYYRGVNQARVQSNVRSLMDEISQKLQLSDGTSFRQAHPEDTVPPPPGYHIAHAMCIGTTRYNYVLNKQIGAEDPISHQTVTHVLWRDTVPAGNCPIEDDFWNSTTLTGGTELIAPRARLTSFSVSSTEPYKIKIGVAYGDGDLLCNTAASDDCSKDSDEYTTDAAGNDHRDALKNVTDPYDIVCRSRKGSHFCATSALQTTVVKRLINQ